MNFKPKRRIIQTAFSACDESACNPMELKRVRRDIARVKTVMRQHELEAVSK